MYLRPSGHKLVSIGDGGVSGSSLGAVGAALEAAVQTGDRQVQEQLAAGFAEVGEQFGEFAFVLTDLRDELRLIQDGVNEQSGRSRLATDLLYQQGTDIRSLLDIVSALDLRARDGPDQGSHSDGGPRWTGGCPYRGRVPFTEADAQVFYGRQHGRHDHGQGQHRRNGSVVGRRLCAGYRPVSVRRGRTLAHPRRMGQLRGQRRGLPERLPLMGPLWPEP